MNGCVLCMYPSTELKVLDNEVLLLNVHKLARHKTSYRDKQIKLYITNFRSMRQITFPSKKVAINVILKGDLKSGL